MTFLPTLPSVNENSENSENSNPMPYLLYFYSSGSEFVVKFTDLSKLSFRVKSVFTFCDHVPNS